MRIKNRRGNVVLLSCGLLMALTFAQFLYWAPPSPVPRSTETDTEQQDHPLLTPTDIPKLSSLTKLQLVSRRRRPNFFVDETDIMRHSENIFAPLARSEHRSADTPAGAGTATATAPRPRSLHFRGVMRINGERYAILEREGRQIPWYVREGEQLTGTRYQLRNISSDDGVVTLEQAGGGQGAGTLLSLASAPGRIVDTMTPREG